MDEREPQSVHDAGLALMQAACDEGRANPATIGRLLHDFEAAVRASVSTPNPAEALRSDAAPVEDGE